MVSNLGRRLFQDLIYLAYLLLLALFAWALHLSLHHPSVCAEWSFSSGVVSLSAQPCPIHRGDRILSLNRLPVSEARALPQGTIGQSVAVVYSRAGQTHQVDLTLRSPTGLLLFNRLVPLLVGLSFLAQALLLTMFARSLAEIHLAPLVIFSVLLFLTLLTGAVSSFAPLFLVIIFHFLIIWVGPITVDTHRRLTSQASSEFNRILVPLTYAVSAMLSLLAMVALGPDPLVAAFSRTINLIWLGICWAIALSLLVIGYKREQSVDVRRRLGTLALANAAAFLPFIVFSLLPEALFDRGFLPYPIAMSFFILLPLGYGYAVLRYRLVRMNRFINRSLSAFLTVMVVSVLYMLLYELTHRLIHLPGPPPPDSLSIVNLAVVILLLFIAQPVYQITQRRVNMLLYGEPYDYRSAVRAAQQTMDRSSAPSALYQSIPEAVQKVLQLNCVWLFVPDRTNQLIPVGRAAVEPHDHPPKSARAVKIWRKIRAAPHAASASTPFSLHSMLEWEDPLPCEHAEAYLPMVGNRGITGVLVLGQKVGNGGLDRNDLEILQAVAHQASLLLENSQLIANLNQQAEERRSLYEKNLLAREEERHHLARELHDQVIQELAGVHYALSNLVLADNRLALPLRDIQDQIRSLMEDVRSICAGLRPPALDSQGLVAALQSIPRTLWKPTADGLPLPEVQFSIQGDPEINIPEAVQMTVYRAFQELMQNILKHAQASQVHVALNLGPTLLMLMVEDNGRGFTPPELLHTLTHYQHFGLAGIEERIEIMQGEMKVDSQPGEGCRVFIRIPLTGVHAEKTQPLQEAVHDPQITARR